MNMYDGIDGGTISRYLAGMSSDSEDAEVRAWEASDPANARMLASLRLAWEAAGEPEPEWDEAAAWWKMRARIRHRPDPTRGRGPALLTRRLRSAFSTPLTATAGGLVAASVGIVLLAVGGVRGLLTDAAAPAAMQELITQKGERAEFRLADGTRVVVGPESRLRVPVGFGASVREVHLVGQAFFDVTADPERPFLVRAGELVTRVLGTEFNVRAYPEEAEVAVVVEEGRVLVRPENVDSSVVLTRGDLGQLRAGATQVTTRKVDLEHHLSWRQGRLAFDRTPLEQVCVDLERWYGTPVRVGDPALASLRVTASFRDQPLDEVVALIAASLDVRHSEVGRTVVFLPKQTAVRLAL